MIRIRLVDHQAIVPLLAGGGRTVLAALDTGTPFATVFRDPRVVTFALGEAVLPVSRGPAVDGARALADWDEAARRTGLAVGAVLGRDVLERFDLLLDLPARTLLVDDEIDDEGLHEAPLRIWLGVPRVEARIGARETLALLDTGTRHTALRSDLADGAGLRPRGETFEDRVPPSGPFRAALHEAPVRVGGADLGIRPVAVAPDYDRALAGFPGVGAILGLSAFEAGTLLLGWRRARIAVGPGGGRGRSPGRE